MRLIKLFFCSLLCLFCTSCLVSRTSHPALSTPHLAPLTSYTVPLTSIHYRGTATINLNAPTQVCQFTIVNVTDSFLYVQLNVGGLEAGRTLATPDNILFINRLQKNYYNGDYSVFEKMLDMELDFYTLQNIFNGTPASLPEEVELSYQTDSLSYDYPFFSTLLFEYFALSIKLDVKKVTFNAAHEVSATIPKNFTEIEI